MRSCQQHRGRINEERRGGKGRGAGSLQWLMRDRERVRRRPHVMLEW